MILCRNKAFDMCKSFRYRFYPSCAGLKHLDAGCETPAGGMNPPEVPKTRESTAGRWVRISIGWPPTDIKGNGGMISRIRALVSF